MIKDYYYKAPPNNFLFPILRPHLFLVSIKISIIPYSFTIFWLFLNTLKAQELIFNGCQLTCLNRCNYAFKV